MEPETRARVLLVEDDPSFAATVRRVLERTFDVDWVADVDGARRRWGETPYAAVLTDVRLGDDSREDGIDLVTELLAERPLLPVVVMTAFGDVETAVRALRAGAAEFVEKGHVSPQDIRKLIQTVVQEARRKLSLDADANRLRSMAPTELVGGSAAHKRVLELVETAAQDGQCSVLIVGETGTGKDLVARAIHAQGWRSGGPYVAVSLPGLAPGVAESELFGHERGAFTGATSRRLGLLEAADAGVLFLDEVGDASVDLQVKLLRALEERKVTRVGSTKGVPVDIQVVAATNQSLPALIAEGQFREDLFYRISTLVIELPPLRDRASDIPLVADHFLHRLRMEGRTKLGGFSNGAVSALSSYAFPGNFRQLRNVVEASVLTSHRAGHWVIEVDDLPEEILSGSSYTEVVEDEEEDNYSRAIALAELECVSRALERANGIKSVAQDFAGYQSRHTMRRRLDQIRLAHPDLWERFATVKAAYE